MDIAIVDTVRSGGRATRAVSRARPKRGKRVRGYIAWKVFRRCCARYGAVARTAMRDGGVLGARGIVARTGLWDGEGC